VSDAAPGQTQELTSIDGDTTRGVAGNAAIVAAAFVLSRVLGLVREMLIAARFGTGPDYDAYVAAFRIPDLLFLVVMSGAFGSAFIPVFGGLLARGDRARAWRLANTVLTLALVVLAAASLLTVLLAGWLIRALVAPGLAPPQQELATDLTRLLLLSPLLLGLGAAGKGMLEAQHAFAVAAFAPVLYNLGIILGALFLAPAYGPFGLAIGVIGGAIGHAGIQFLDLLRRGWRFVPALDLRTEGLDQVGRLMAPRILGQAAFQINMIVLTNFASRLGERHVSALNYAFQLFMLPHGVLALSLSTVIFPLMARQFAVGDLPGVRRTLQQALSPLLFLTIPATLGLLLFRTSIVQVLFQFGAFSATSTELVAAALGYFAPGLVAFAVVEAVTRAFYAMHDTLTPVLAAVVTIAANIALSWLLMPSLGHRGLALSLSLTTTLEMAILLLVLRRRLGGFGTGLLGSLARVLAAGALMAAAGWWLAGPLAIATDPATGRSVSQVLAFAYTLAAVAACYFVAAYFLSVPELQTLFRRIASKRRSTASNAD